jgi:DNA-binding NarL/FixJ family response regulator
MDASLSTPFAAGGHARRRGRELRQRARVIPRCQIDLALGAAPAARGPRDLGPVGGGNRQPVETIGEGHPAAGLACYRQGELLRLRGDFDVAEEAYLKASSFGREPQPGLAQLRLAEGRGDAAVSTIRSAEAAATTPLDRAALLPALVEIELEAGEVDAARRAADELGKLAADFESAMLAAIAAHARGAVSLAEGEPREALACLRRAFETWHALDAPYEIARTRVLVGDACRRLGDEESATLEHDAARSIFGRLGAKPDLARLSATSGAADHGLSPRELEVIRLVAAGSTNREIAAALVISEHTVARHLQNIYAKLGISSRAAATAYAFEHDLV